MITFKRSILYGIFITLFVVLTLQATAQSIQGPDTNVCTQTTEFYAVTGSNASCNFSWTATNGTVTATGFSCSVVWNSTTSGALQVHITGSGCGDHVITLPVSLKSIGTPVAPSPYYVLCGVTSTTISLTSGGSNADHWIWTLPTGVTAPGGTTTTTPSIAVNFSTGTTVGTVTVKGQDLSCSSATVSTVISIPLTRTPPGPTLTKNSGTHYELCSGETWTVTATDIAGSSYGYDWYIQYSSPPGGSGILIDGGSGYTSGSPYHTASNVVTISELGGYGVFSVVCRANNGTCAGTWSNFGGGAGPFNTSQFSITGPASLCESSVGDYNAYTPYATGITGYVWSWSSGFPSASGQGTSTLHVTSSPGFSGGSVALQLQNRCGTSSASVKNITLKLCPFRMSVSPNPVSDSKLTLHIERGDVANVMEKESVNPLVTEMQANLINQATLQRHSFTLNKSVEALDVSALPSGNYILKVSDGTNEESLRVIIKR